ncbi:MAG TPA: non-ribosomal peptide synthetase [Streptosporangiaceae bacterium]|jgi:amino acid adenylation domain-containing protein
MMSSRPDRDAPAAAADALRRFERAARAAPGRVAVRGSDGELSFAALDAETARLAGELAALGVARGDRVGVCLPRGARLVVALLAAWRAGAAYVPLDPRYPDDRLAFMAADTAIRALVTEPGSRFRPAGVRLAELPGLAGRPATGPGGPGPARAAAPSPQDLAYAIFTSGTTGRPKAVGVTHGGVAALLAALENFGAYAAAPRVVAWNASVSFDASVQQWARVCRGDTVIVVDDEDRTDPERMRALLAEHAVTDLDLTPSHWELLRAALLRPRTRGGVLRLFMGGEPVPERAWRELAGAARDGILEALNLYGPTECSVDATAAWVSGDSPHIGRALPGVRGYVLDGALREAADGAGGELYLAGAQLARGYLSRPGLTATRFVADPRGAPGSRMYRTGDLARRTAGGTLEFAGRGDRQVKLRGYRVELAEIESVLRAHPGVASAAVLVCGDEAAGDRLVACCVPSGTALPPAEELLGHAARSLPDFMVPSGVVALRELPLTVHGKLDVAALGDAWRTAGTSPGSSGAARPAMSASERLVAGVWSEVLGREQVAAHDNFFALGGHSLLALRAVTRLKADLGVTIAVRDVYRHPRLSDLAGYVDALAARAER